MSSVAPDRTVLVTGASRGIGASIARRLAFEGWAVLVAARGEAGCARTAEEIREAGGVAWPLVLDVADDSALPAALERGRELCASTGPIAGLVNNAGIAVSAALTAAEQDELCERHMRVNFHGARRLVERLLPDMKARGFGRIVNVASSAGLRGYAYVSAYCASKHALVGYTRAAAEELARTDVRMQVICPHYVDSPMLEQSVERVVEKTGKPRDEVLAFFAAENPGGRLVTPGEVADAVLFAMSEAENGAVLELDGSPGHSLR